MVVHRVHAGAGMQERFFRQPSLHEVNLWYGCTLVEFVLSATIDRVVYHLVVLLFAIVWSVWYALMSHKLRNLQLNGFR